jgi:hypothetical protein
MSTIGANVHRIPSATASRAMRSTISHVLNIKAVLVAWKKRTIAIGLTVAFDELRLGRTYQDVTSN